ncbi:MAG TPA: SagB/ThcOx family dehydrogenase [Nitrospiraceae bacterium]|nr:SagB/ThcOx family dehydrogenase [Nitrospiraceae bacterium]
MSDEQPFHATPTDVGLTDPVERVIRYHVRTKHHFNRYARSLGFLDWANQPDPFRRYDGGPLIALPLLSPRDEPVSPSYEAIYQRGAVPSRPVTIPTLSRFLEFALALSAWKRVGETQWALRSNPSSGNLHPTEGYLVLPALNGLDLDSGLYHYAPREHGLERRAEFPAEQTARLLHAFPRFSFLVGLSSVHWRESWKYGERAFRYCNHDVGHAIATARIAAATLGWAMVLLDGTDQHTVATLLGTNRPDDYLNAEPEHPDCVAVVWPMEGGTLAAPSASRTPGHTKGDIPLFLDHRVVNELASARWYGKANRLSRDTPVPWEIIDDAAAASWKFSREPRSIGLPDLQSSAGARTATDDATRTVEAVPSAGQIIRQRRSAVAFDGKTSIAADTFYRMMRRVMPLADRSILDRPMPWDVVPWDPAIHLLLFVHRIDGLTPGIYVLARDHRKVPWLRQAMNPELEWTPAPGCPSDLPLYWLLEGNAQRLAAQVSCHQDIAGDSAFSLGMLAEFDELLRHRGAWWYPRLFWEAGLVGQVLYLEAEAAGVRATGIGCFFDDPVHEIVGINQLSMQSLYHFTIGGPVEDMRLQTLAPYHHLLRRS